MRNGNFRGNTVFNASDPRKFGGRVVRMSIGGSNAESVAFQGGAFAHPDEIRKFDAQRAQEGVERLEAARLLAERVLGNEISAIVASPEELVDA